jgi:transcriptional regulator with XRE-family HTH domain
VDRDPDQIIQDVGHRIAELRQCRQLTQRELAVRVGMSHPNLNRIEQGTQNLTLRTMITLATALDVELSDLLKPPGSGHPRKRKPARSGR